VKRTPLVRKTPLRTKRAARRRSERERDTPYMALVRRMPCVAGGLGPCNGPIEADHAGPRPLGRKADDRTCVAMCQFHHHCRHAFAGPFRRWSRAQMRGFLEFAIALTRGAIGEVA
jgi:hypothetical protein